MKKIIALLMIFSLSLTLFACGKADGGKDTHIEVLHESVNIILPKKRG